MPNRLKKIHKNLWAHCLNCPTPGEIDSKITGREEGHMVWGKQLEARRGRKSISGSILENFAPAFDEMIQAHPNRRVRKAPLGKDKCGLGEDVPKTNKKKTKSAKARWRSEKGFYAAFLQRPHCLPLIGAFYVYWKKVVKSVDGSGGSERGKHKAHRTPWISSTVGNWKICFRFKWFSFAGDKLHFTIRWL